MWDMTHSYVWHGSFICDSLRADDVTHTSQPSSLLSLFPKKNHYIHVYTYVRSTLHGSKEYVAVIKEYVAVIYGICCSDVRRILHSNIASTFFT